MTTLNLSWNNLGDKLRADLAIAFKAIPVGVTTLDLSGNYLGNILAEAFKAIPVGVTTLDLGWNNLGNKPGADLAEAFAAIPVGVATLNLRENHLDNKSGADLAIAFAAIPVSVTTLNLSGNNLDNKPRADLAEAFAALPAGVSVKYGDNKIQKKAEVDTNSSPVKPKVRPQNTEEEARQKTQEKIILPDNLMSGINNVITQLEATKNFLAKKAETKIEYKEIAKHFETLYKEINNATNEFIKEPTKDNFTSYYKQCTTAFKNTELKKIAKEHRGWHRIDLIIKAFVGVLATIAVIPAIAVALSSKEGYKKTFFSKKPLTNTAKKLADFKEQFNKAIEVTH